MNLKEIHTIIVFQFYVCLFFFLSHWSLEVLIRGQYFVTSTGVGICIQISVGIGTSREKNGTQTFFSPDIQDNVIVLQKCPKAELKNKPLAEHAEVVSVISSQSSSEPAVMFVTLQCLMCGICVWNSPSCWFLKNRLKTKFPYICSSCQITRISLFCSLLPSQPHSQSTCHRHRGLSFLDASQIQWS